MRRWFVLGLCLAVLLIPVSAQGEAGVIALTFDDGPSGRYTRTLLDGLAERDVKATFLLCGYRIEQYPREAQRIAEEGHEIGNHGFSHKNMQTMGTRELAKEIEDTNALIPDFARVRFLRPPGGCCSANVKQVAAAKQLAILSWSVDPKDWATKDADSVYRFVAEHVKDGDIILLHDMSDSSVQAAFRIIDDLTARGFRFVTVSELARLRNVPIRAGKSYSAFPGKAGEGK